MNNVHEEKHQVNITEVSTVLGLNLGLIHEVQDKVAYYYIQCLLSM